MNLLVKTVEKPRRGAVLASGIQQAPVKAFMDDLTIMARSFPEGRRILEDLFKIIAGARMEFKPAKSRIIVLRKGRVHDQFHFRIGEDLIPTVSERPIKSLGKWFRVELNDRESVKEMLGQAEAWMRAVDRSGLPGRFKLWGYQHGVLPRLLWPLLMYEVPLTTVEALERRINTFLRRWLSVPKSLSSIGLYSSRSKLQLPLTSVVEEFKVAKARQVIILCDSRDQLVRQADTIIHTGQKWSASRAVADAEARLCHKDIVGMVNQGRLGLGIITRARWRDANAKGRCSLVQEQLRCRVGKRGQQP